LNDERLTAFLLTLVVILLILLEKSLLLSVVSATAAVTTTTTNATTSTTNPPTATPIKHLVVIYQENVAFDHYFATYPKAANPDPLYSFHASPNTPSINGLTTAGLLTNNTNLANPFRLDRSQAALISLCNPDHDYTALQKSFNGGLMDKFVENSGLQSQKNCAPKLVMGYFDGNTITALWRYAQHYAMSDNFYSSNIGPSFPGHLNLISGQTHGATPTNITDNVVNGTVIGDIPSVYDDCSKGKKTLISMSGKNIGDLLNEKGISWGWFQGGFKPSGTSADNKPVCGYAHMNIAGKNVTDYVVHHEPFQYYKSTANPHHLPPTSAAMVGKTDQANHQYDLSDFWNAWRIGNLPAVSFLKAPQYQTGHPGYSDPIADQRFLESVIDSRLQNSPQWRDGSTAIIIAYDDSGGWYDHVMPPIISQSNDPKYDSLVGSTGLCGHAPSEQIYQDRCGYGARLPMLVLSPYAKVNYVDHSITDQSSILRFIEDNWHLGRIGNQSFDAKAGSIMNMFDFSRAKDNHVFLNPASGLEIQNATAEGRAK
jgi:phospholipase C